MKEVIAICEFSDVITKRYELAKIVQIFGAFLFLRLSTKAINILIASVTNFIKLILCYFSTITNNII